MPDKTVNSDFSYIFTMKINPSPASRSSQVHHPPHLQTADIGIHLWFQCHAGQDMLPHHCPVRYAPPASPPFYIFHLHTRFFWISSSGNRPQPSRFPTGAKVGNQAVPRSARSDSVSSSMKNPCSRLSTPASNVS